MYVKSYWQFEDAEGWTDKNMPIIFLTEDKKTYLSFIDVYGHERFEAYSLHEICYYTYEVSTLLIMQIYSKSHLVNIRPRKQLRLCLVIQFTEFPFQFLKLHSQPSTLICYSKFHFRHCMQ